MAIYVGETLTISAGTVNFITGAAISDASAFVEFYAPGKNPKTVAADRVKDHGPYTMVYEPLIANRVGDSGGYVGYVDTTGWVAGKWAYQVKLTGQYDSWEYGTFTLVA